MGFIRTIFGTILFCVPHFRTEKVFIFYDEEYEDWQPHAVVSQADEEDNTGWIGDVSYLSFMSWGFFPNINNVRKFK